MRIDYLIDVLAEFVENKIPEKYLINFQELLLASDILTVASRLLVYLFIIIIFLIFLFILFSFIFNFNILILFLFALAIPPGVLMIFIIYKSEKRNEKIETSIPDFLRQLSSMLRVGLSFETALEELSKYGSGPLYNEIRRSVIEIKMGMNFDKSIMEIAERLKSKNLERSFKLIIEAKKTGGSLADIIEDISNDLRDLNALKRERKSSVMMSIIFLVISAVIAAPFALGMIGIYSSFMEDLGKGNQLIETSKIAAGSYIVIHSILVGLIISIVMYGNLRRGIKFSIPLLILAYGLFYIISNFGSSFLGL
ncbi:hypothetical protein SDC9_03538 [bioreactor metagenome]|uniref:Type II secretion system protein GspF domain-containing protein n=1 Tax=bioreactor metagenome TaxID=1076179 RepID=A0A644STS1_9ZZZZ|nr:type II secretion system F family protein [Methanobrevibacter sp.]MEA4956157.1 type II secretion system F family protein [Methanobrevibacter sp.]